MGSQDYKEMERLESEKLYEFLSDNDSSTRKWKAIHILETRRFQPMADAAKSSARAAKLSAVAAFVSAVTAILTVAFK